MSSTWAEPQVMLIAAAVPAALMLFLFCFATRIPPRGVTRRRLTCPLRERDASVDFVVRDDGGEAYLDVVACSVVGPGHEIQCGRPCRSTGVAPFTRAGLA